MKIALIHAPFHHRKFSENLKVVDEEFTLAPPIIVAYIAAILEKEGHGVILIDAHALKLSKEDALKRVNAFNPDLIGFRLDTYGFQETLDWIRYFKLMTGKPIIAGGINLSIYPYETMAHKEIDFGLIGEAVESLPMFLNCFGDEKQYKKIPGLCRRDENGAIIVNPASNYLAPFDNYPFPARHLLPNHLYHSFVSQVKNFTIMLTSTGCPYKCKFCAIAALGHWRQRSVDNVIKEIEQCYYDYGIREIDFFDATFFVNKRWSIKFCEEIIKRKINITWTARSRVDLVDEDVLNMASKAGCRMIFWGIESSSQNVLNQVNKEITPRQVSYAIKTAKKFGIRNLGFLMVGNPGDNKESIKQTVKFAKDLDLDYVQICRAIPKPDTQFHKELVQKTGFDYWKEFVSLKVGEERIPTLWNMPQDKAEKLLKWSYYSFYFRPSYILGTLRKIKSIDEFARYTIVGLKMLLNYLHTDVKAPPCNQYNRVGCTGGAFSNGEDKKVYVVIPAYNEKDNIMELMKKISASYPRINMIVMDSSHDGTREEIKRFSKLYPKVEAHYVKKTNIGNERGSAIKEGFQIALSKGADLIIEMDADLSHNPSDIGELIYNCENFDMVIGSRYISFGGEVGRSWFRLFLGQLANLYIKYSIGIKDVYDCTSGYRCFKRDALEKIGLDYLKSIEGTESLIEMLYLGFKKGLKIKEVPITYLERKYGSSKFSLATITMSLKRVWVLKWGGV
ncbi:MAG: radical SAM protein [Elusimicrobia bacterium]|nr:radical SAM protein [Elusimicrobiota bacterium]